MEGERATGCGVQVVCRRMVRPLTTLPTAKGKEDVEVIHLTPWDLRLLGTGYIQKGVLLPRPPAGGGGDVLVSALECSFARALHLFYPLAGRLATDDLGDGTVAVLLRCTGEGAELVHAVAPSVAAADVVCSLYTQPVVRELFPLARARSAEAAVEPLPVLAAQVTELADAVFLAVALNHAVADGSTLWNFVNAWSEIHRLGVGVRSDELSTPPPVLRRWFLESCAVPVPMPLGKRLERLARQPQLRLGDDVRECFFTFSAASVQRLTARANAEVSGTATATVSSLEAVLAHLWRAVCRARRLPPERGTFYTVVIGCQGRVDGVPRGYVGNAMVFGKAEATAREIEEKGLGWTARLLGRVVAAASADEAGMREMLERWVRDPGLTRMGDLSSAGALALGLATGVSPWSEDVFGNDFGWGKPVAVRSGPGNKADGKAAVFQGPEEGGSMSLEVCLAPDVLAGLLNDGQFMGAVMEPPSRPSL
ncbi:hypothetical protein BS78_07G014600 [Paspalum vaginatum]|nr:hypothetical protein BS78_07G014600 [Paspalum vaginatum]